MSSQETWKPIDGYVGLYDVSNLGRVRSLRSKTQAHKLKPDGVLSLNKANRDYLRITLNDGCGQKTHLVHRLVASAFIGEIPTGYDVNHKNGIKTDNRVDNLEIVTKQRNSKHAVEMGMLKVVGSENPMAKLNESAVIDIKQRLFTGQSNASIARIYGVSGSAITMIKNNRTWKHVQIN